MIEGDLRELGRRALEDVARADDADQLELVRQRYLGRHGGSISQVAAELPKLSAPDRALLGRSFNEVKRALEAALERRQEQLRSQQLAAAADQEWADLSAPAGPLGRGHQHPVARVVREIEDVFAALGYESLRGPEVEDDRHNFELLNMAAEHPARDTQDTFYLDGPGGWLLRTHTSPMQLRVMMSGPPPYRIIVPGKVYRRDNPDPTHNPAFHQIEGLCVGDGVAMSHLKATLVHVVRAIFGPDRGVRFRASYFPYTEPSMEVDIACAVCGGAGCRACLQKGWIEMLGSGMVHPVVLRNAGVDPSRYSGFAFGMGPDRIAALKYGIEDIRDLYEDDLRFLGSF